MSTVAVQRGIPAFRVLSDEDARSDVDRLRRQTLVMGLSDGARIDGVRHSNVGLLTNEQLVLATHSEVVMNSVDPSEIVMLIHGPKTLVDKAQRQQLGNALRVLPNSDIMLARLAPGVLYLEGHTDLAILKEWARILDHPVRKLFDSPAFLWRPTVWEVADGVAGIKSRQHFDAMRLVEPSLKALEILDGDSAGEQQATPLTGEGYQKLKWTRYEIESYLFHPAVLERFAQDNVGDAGALAMREHLQQNMPPRFMQEPLVDLPMLLSY